MKFIYYVLTAFTAATLLLVSCKKEETTASVSYGTEQKLGSGTAKSFVRLDASSNPTEVGVAISEAAFNSLPHSGADLVLELPSTGSKTPYKHVFLNYVHGGHPPHGIYTTDHFDVHFYTVASSVRESITTPTDTRMFKFPEKNLLPANYDVAGPVPQMGMHWADTTAAEFKGQPFTATYLWGSLDSEIIFHEPMVTVAFMKQKLHSHFPVKQPAQYKTSGYYPKEYCVRFNETDKQYEVLLENLTLK